MEYFLIDQPGETYYPRPEGSILINSPRCIPKGRDVDKRRMACGKRYN